MRRASLIFIDKEVIIELYWSLDNELLEPVYFRRRLLDKPFGVLLDDWLTKSATSIDDRSMFFYEPNPVCLAGTFRIEFQRNDEKQKRDTATC